MTVFGYKILNKSGEVVDEIVGHVSRKVLDKYRNSGLRVKKLTMPKQLEEKNNYVS
jgi:hypothetical protein